MYASRECEAALFSSLRNRLGQQRKKVAGATQLEDPGSFRCSPSSKLMKTCWVGAAVELIQEVFGSALLSFLRFFAVSLAANVFDRCRDFVVSKQCDTLISSGFSVTHHELNRWIGTLKKTCELMVSNLKFFLAAINHRVVVASPQLHQSSKSRWFN